MSVVADRTAAGGARAQRAGRPAPLRRIAAALFAPGALLAMLAARSETLLLPVQQGTDLGVTAGQDGQLVIDLAGRLWSLPADGGKALAITPPGEFARRATFSPDGQSLAYQSLRGGAFQVIVTDAHGGNPHEITQGPANHVAPAWSPDGRRLAVASDRGGDFSIWSVDIDTREMQQLSFEPGEETDPAWDPRGKSVAYVSDQPGGSSLVVRSPFQQPRTLVSSGRPLRAPSWRPDGSVITYTAGGPQGTHLDMVILSDPPVVKPVSRTEAASSAPVAWLDRNQLIYAADGVLRRREFGVAAGSDIAFEATLEVRTAGEPPARSLIAPIAAEPVVGLAGIAVLPNGHVIASALGDLWEFTAAGELVRKLTDDAFVERDPAASADGGSLAFTSDRDGSTQVWALDLGTGALRQVTAEPGYAMHPSWSPGGDRLAFLAGAGTGAAPLRLVVADAATGATRVLAANLGEPCTPAWSPDGARLGVIQHEQGVARFVLYATDGSAGVRRVTLPDPAVGPGVNEAQWSADGKSLLIASASGIRALPVLDNGLVGAEWRSLGDGPAQLARWIPGEDAAYFTDATGLGRAGGAAGTSRIALPLAWRPAPAAGRTVIRASRVFDVEHGGYLVDQDIVIEGNRITAVAPQSAAAVDGALVIDASGKTVMPGLIDLALQVSDVAGERLGRTLLAYGITTAQVMAAPNAELREVAERWRSHGAGPRLLGSSEWCGVGPLPAGDNAALLAGAVRLCPAALGRLAEIAPAVRAARLPAWSPSWIAAVSGSVDAVGPLGGLDAGLAVGLPRDPVAGGVGLYQDAIDVMVRTGTLLVTALGARGLPALLEQQPDLLEASQYGALFSEAERQANAAAWAATTERDGAWRRTWLRDSQRLLGRFAAGGGRLAPASASPLTPYGLGLHAELRLLAGAGLGRAQVLRMATVEAARALGLQNEIGVVAAGRVADLLIIDGDPLADLRQLLRIDAVVVDGRVRLLSELTYPPVAAAKKFTPPRNAEVQKSGRRRD